MVHQEFVGRPDHESDQLHTYLVGHLSRPKTWRPTAGQSRHGTEVMHGTEVIPSPGMDHGHEY